MKSFEISFLRQIVFNHHHPETKASILSLSLMSFHQLNLIFQDQINVNHYSDIINHSKETSN